MTSLFPNNIPNKHPGDAGYSTPIPNDMLNGDQARAKCDQLEYLIKMIPKQAVRCGFIKIENDKLKEEIVNLKKMMIITMEKNNAYQLITQRDEQSIKCYKLTKENKKLKEEIKDFKENYVPYQTTE
tara:strand:+ start:281 stop:661 length:381 start_codon:yes stop_codon:yes gene_type:complete